MAYKSVIEIRPMNVKEYLELADAYIVKDDYESAFVTLQKGHGLTEDEAMKNKVDEVNVEVEKIRLEEIVRVTQ